MTISEIKNRIKELEESKLDIISEAMEAYKSLSWTRMDTAERRLRNINSELLGLKARLPKEQPRPTITQLFAD